MEPWRGPFLISMGTLSQPSPPSGRKKLMSNEAELVQGLGLAIKHPFAPKVWEWASGIHGLHLSLCQAPLRCPNGLGLGQ